MSWSETQIKQHLKTANLLNKIIIEIVNHLKNNPVVTDLEVRNFIKDRYKKYHLKSDRQSSIVAFGVNTAEVHYYASAPQRLKPGNLVLVDIWGRLAEKGAPFADITWMMYYGRKLPQTYERVFNIVAGAREAAIKNLRGNLKKKITPIGKDLDAAVRKYLAKQGCEGKFLHGTGHSLGLTSPHGRLTRLNRRGRRPIPLNVGYTIEPGIYFKNKFGLRSEIDFYVDQKHKLIITTKLQKNIIKI